MIPLRNCDGGFGEVAEETEDESKDRVERLGDRGNGLCDGAAMAQRIPGFWERSQRETQNECCYPDC
jgi:hypothetical protein